MTNTSNDGPRISICCESGTLHHHELRCIRNASFPLKKLVLPDIYDSNFSISDMKSIEFVPRYRIPCSEDSFYLQPYPSKKDVYFLMENGMIYINTSISGLVNYWLGINDYCFTSRGNGSAVLVCTPYLPSSSNVDTFSNTPTYLIVYSTLANLSIPFLIATFLVYTILPELKNIHGLILRIYVAGLLLTHILFGTLVFKPILLCTYVIEIMVQYSMLSNYFWLNVMSFDIWQTFRGLEDSSKHRNRKKFAMYSIYAWGLSALITGISSIIDFIPNLPKGIIRPGLIKGCWFTDNMASAIYFHGPINLAIISNIIFFALTAIKMFRHEKSTAHHLKRQTGEKQRFKLYLKLFIVMGTTEATQLISLLWPEIPIQIQLLLDVPSALQGLSIFIIFVCKNNILQLLFKRLRCQRLWPKNSMFKTRRNHSSATTSTTTTTRTSFQEKIDVTSV